LTKTIIKVENLSKRYRLGLKEKKSDTLMGQISQTLRAPWENLQKLRKLNRFGEEDDSVFWALKDVSFEVKEGDVLGIIGKNGAGKSTLLKILSQITEPTSGRIKIHGRVASLLEVGTGFHSELSGKENIYMNGTILGMSRREIDSKLDEIIDFSGVEKFIDTPVKFYSSGMKVRLGFSVAAHLEPEILIIDEVLAVGDYEFQRKCLGKMEDVSKNQGRTVLFVSHQMDAIKSLCTKCILLSNGEISIEDETSNVLQKYLGSFEFSNEVNYISDVLKKSITSIKLDSNLLKQGILKLTCSFFSPEIIKKPIMGFVLYNQIDSPVFGSNPRYHSKNYEVHPSSSGVIEALTDISNLHSGIYKISIWFGDENQDFDHKSNALIFEWISWANYNQKPNTIMIGSIDQNVEWSFVSN
jgi:lipopolysaccharide transport system ATP-binding protein